MDNINFTANEAAEYLKISKSLLYKLTSNSVITFSKPNGGKIFFQKKDLDGWVAKNKQKSISETQDELNSKIGRNGK